LPGGRWFAVGGTPEVQHGVKFRPFFVLPLSSGDFLRQRYPAASAEHFCGRGDTGLFIHSLPGRWMMGEKRRDYLDKCGKRFCGQGFTPAFLRTNP
jgi:hypothetical protein